LRVEGEVGYFLGLIIEKQWGSSFLLTQTGLIDKVINTGSIEGCKKVATPAETTHFNDTWKYDSIIGMVWYLAPHT
jgi:hypothetical protein